MSNQISSICGFCSKSVLKSRGGLKNHLKSNSKCKRAQEALQQSMASHHMSQGTTQEKSKSPDSSSQDQESPSQPFSLFIDPPPNREPNPQNDVNLASIPNTNQTQRDGRLVYHVDEDDVFQVDVNSFAGWEETKQRAEGGDVWEQARSDEEKQVPSFAPWANKDEFDFAQRLLKTPMSMADLDSILTSKYMADPTRTFNTADEMRGNIRMMKGGPEWQQKEFKLPDAPNTPIIYWSRDLIGCVKHLVQNPAFHESFDYAPKKIHSRKGGRIYSEMSSGDMWHRQQATLRHGTTLIPIILASDATHLTNFSGGKKAHAVYMSLGNIHKEVRNAPSNNAWILVALLPTNLKFEAEKFPNKTQTEAMPGLLAHQAFHRCMRDLLYPLRKDQQRYHVWRCPDGKKRRCHPKLMVWIADLPEQQMIACVRSKSCPVCPCSSRTLGDEHHVTSSDVYRVSTLDTLKSVRTANPNALLWDYAGAVRKINSDVHGATDSPCWEGLDLGPEEFLVEDLLHGSHKFMWDHVVTWLQDILGDKELDHRFISQPPVGHERLRKGISALSQISGSEQKTIQRFLIPVIAGCDGMTQGLMNGVRSLQDYIYHLQFPSASESELEAMLTFLSEFHRNKHLFKSLGARDHFNIPKLHKLGHCPRNIKSFGTLDGYSTETPEALHKSIKEMYRLTNHVEAERQILVRLELFEKVHFRETYLALREAEKAAKVRDFFILFTAATAPLTNFYIRCHCKVLSLTVVMAVTTTAHPVYQEVMKWKPILLLLTCLIYHNSQARPTVLAAWLSNRICLQLRCKMRRSCLEFLT
ncbi:hypothetical protein DL93DRAFT_2131236 [Clavulina sp. PMI_390]|nr:hypothetical protein DL93DRAFT_2131236 [Clavulina sp. PMI_390]